MHNKAMGALIEATRENFWDLVASGPAIVDVWGPECAPCLALMPHMEDLAVRYPQVKMIKLEAPKARRICIELKVMGMPAFLFFNEAKEVSRLVDSNPKPALIDQWISENLEALEGVK